MLVCFGLLLILSGLAIMTFGLYMFYAWLPLLYGLLGLDIGLLLGNWLSGEVGLVAIVFGLAGAIALAGAAHILEPYRRIFVGFSVGALFSLLLSYFLALNSLIGGFFGTVLAVGGGIAGAMIVPQIFNSIIIAASAFGGAAIAMAGAHWLLPDVGLFDSVDGGFLPRLITTLLALVGVSWQLRNIETWVQLQPMLGDVPVNSKGSEGGPSIPQRRDGDSYGQGTYGARKNSNREGR